MSLSQFIKWNNRLTAGLCLSAAIYFSDCDPALALLSDYVSSSNATMRIGAIFGLGLAYAGSDRAEIIQLLLPVFADATVASNMEIVGMTALALGLISVGSCNDDVTTVLLQTLMEKSEKSGLELKDPFAKFLPLGIGLCFLGRQEAAEAMIAALEVLPEPFRSMATTLVDICAYAGTGNVLKIQSLLHICSEHYEPAEKEEKKDSKSKDDKKDEKKEDASSAPGSFLESCKMSKVYLPNGDF